MKTSYVEQCNESLPVDQAPEETPSVAHKIYSVPIKHNGIYNHPSDEHLLVISLSHYHSHMLFIVT